MVLQHFLHHGTQHEALVSFRIQLHEIRLYNRGLLELRQNLEQYRSLLLPGSKSPEHQSGFVEQQQHIYLEQIRRIITR
jgi:hypothetical protein